MGRVYTYGDFIKAFLPKIGMGWISVHRKRALLSWMYAEGAGGDFNPLNSTLPKPGSHAINSVGVQSYVSFQQGVEATAETLNYGARNNQYGYSKIKRRLRLNLPARHILEAVEESAWGTGGLARRVLLENGKKAVDGYWHRRLPSQ
jgi:hypothetical protein